MDPRVKPGDDYKRKSPGVIIKRFGNDNKKEPGDNKKAMVKIKKAGVFSRFFI